MANETWKFVQAKSKQAMKQALGIRDENVRMRVMLPLAAALPLRRKMTCDGTRRDCFQPSRVQALLYCTRVRALHA